MKSFTIEEINAILKGNIIGDTPHKITGPEEIERAGSSNITFIGNRKYAKKWESSRAAAAIVNEDIDLEPGENRALIK
ncbi:MAG TPA: LpxD N-terminal domain-containing protein, partial [Eudoraea sp.]|nr:LpxD N-terminal domain-containing protein [Eudoraea sp.]